ncbi:signal peptide peptidase SppA [Candidatus Tisiphia endosymbiont of Nedyus quadrimaculatus]|uniref:signal peptide peptidase SppA n=1 Tax=Candidatus Tisiphia endosymbiont of Nedyus quadrimaculatus TaxID=3139332 RepID=UPI00345E7021
MTITPDYIIERKQNKLKLRLWKLATILMFIVLIVVMIKKFNLTSSEYATTNSNYIATVSIEEIIFEDTKRDKRLEKIIDDDKINALIVNVNSPGGTVVGSEKIYNILRKISAKKPVVIVMGTLAASGGYLISLGGDYIISHNGTITGSIGVIFQTLEVTDLAKTLGITFNNFKSGELKAAPNPTEKVTEAVRQAIMSNVQDTYDYFIELVALRRGLAIEEVKKIADGRIYSGRQALKLKLVDAVGSEDDAIKWLQEVKKIDKDLKVKEFKIKPKSKFLEIIMEDFDSVLPSFFKNKFQGIKAVF